MDTDFANNGIVPSFARGFFCCSMCTSNATFQDPAEHIKSPQHISTLKCFNSSFLATPDHIICKVCYTQFDWRVLKNHAKTHELAPWSTPADKYKIFFTNHVQEYDSSLYYCYRCQKYFGDWSAAYLHTRTSQHEELAFTRRSNDFSNPSSVPYDILVTNGLVPSGNFNEVVCNICNFETIHIENVTQHAKDEQHENKKKRGPWLSPKKPEASKTLSITQNTENSQSTSTDAANMINNCFPSIFIVKKNSAEFLCQICNVKITSQFLVDLHVKEDSHLSASKRYGCQYVRRKESINQGIYYCMCCQTPIVGTQNVLQHVRGKRHSQSVALLSATGNNSSKIGNTTINNNITDKSEILNLSLQNQRDEEFFCHLCAKTIKDGQLQHHIQSESHIFGMKQLANHISFKEGAVYHCRCCDRTIIGLNNVYNHIGDTGHVKSITDFEKVQQETIRKNADQMIQDSDNMSEPSTSSASISASANLLFMPKNHIENLETGESRCKLCKVDIKNDSDIQEHLKSEIHRSNDQQLASYVFFSTKKFCYECRCCESSIRGVENIYHHIHCIGHLKTLRNIEKSQLYSRTIDASDETPSIEKINHILKINNNLSHCQVCDCNNLASSTIGGHIAEERHIEKLKIFSAHWNSTISVEKNNKFYCRSCNLSFFHIGDVYEHLRGNKHIIYQNAITKNVNVAASIVSNKPHRARIKWIQSTKDRSAQEVVCRICYIAFKNSSDLHSHLTIHVGNEFVTEEETKTARFVNKRKRLCAALQNDKEIVELQLNSEIVNQSNPRNTNANEAEEISVVSEDIELPEAPEILPSDGKTDSESRQTFMNSDVQTIVELLYLDNDLVFETSEALQEYELGIKLCWIRGLDDLYCLICHRDVDETLQNYYNHLKTSSHRENFKKMKNQHDEMFETASNDRISEFYLANQYMEEINEDLVLCHACKEQLVNSYCSLKSHVNNEFHRDTCNEWHFRAKQHFEATQSNVQCDWYNIHKYRCEPCDKDFTAELYFAKHFVGIKHASVLEKLEQNFFNYFCVSCALLWFGLPSSYESHCKSSKHEWAELRKQYESQELPKSVQNLLINSEEYIDDTIEQISRIAPMQRNEEDTLIRDLEIAVKTELPSAKAFLFKSRADGVKTVDCDVEVFLDCGEMYDGENSWDEEIQQFMIIVNRCLETNSLFWYDDTIYTNRRLSMIKVRHRATDLTCGITFRNGLPVESMKLITYFSEIFAPCRKLILFINQWLLLCDSSELQSIPYQALHWCVIFYLQKESLLPNVASLVKGESRIIAGWEVGVSLDNSLDLSLSETAFTFRALLIRFFKFYANFDYRCEIACPLLGETLKKREFANPQNLPEQMARYSDSVKNSNLYSQSLKIDSPMCIQDPFNLQSNLTENVSKYSLSRFRVNCAKSLNIISSL